VTTFLSHLLHGWVHDAGANPDIPAALAVVVGVDGKLLAMAALWVR
jgi:hypothetical protein